MTMFQNIVIFETFYIIFWGSKNLELISLAIDCNQSKIQKMI